MTTPLIRLFPIPFAYVQTPPLLPGQLKVLVTLSRHGLLSIEITIKRHTPTMPEVNLYKHKLITIIILDLLFFIKGDFHLLNILHAAPHGVLFDFKTAEYVLRGVIYTCEIGLKRAPCEGSRARECIIIDRFLADAADTELRACLVARDVVLGVY